MVARMSFAAVVLVVAGCSSAAASNRPPASLVPASAAPSEVPVAATPASPGQIDLPASIIGPVVADIARVAGVPVHQVKVVSAEPVVFPDGGWGCPVPGMAYIQVQVNGFKLVATVGSDVYDYRGTGPGQFRRCVNVPG